MKVEKEIKLLDSKINLLNAHIDSFNDCGLFSPQEISDLTSPLIPELQKLHEQKLILLDQIQK